MTKYYEIHLSFPFTDGQDDGQYIYFQTSLDTSTMNKQDLAGLACDLGFMETDGLDYLESVTEISREEFIDATTEQV